MKALFFGSGLFDGITLSTVGTAIMIVLLVVIVLVAVALNVVPRFVHKWEIEYKTRDLTYGAVCLAMAYALSWAKMFEMPLGGSVTPAALAPLFIYCYYFGFRKGMAVSSAYMLLQFTQGVYVATPWSAFFDYIFPCTAICIVGLFRYKPNKYSAFVKRNKDKASGAKGSVKYWAYTIGGHWGMLAGTGIYMVVRYLSLTTSGILTWDYWYEPASMAYKLGFSLSYNSFSIVDSLIAIAAVVLLLSSRAFNLYMSASFADRKAFAKGLDAADEQAASLADNADGEAGIDGDAEELAANAVTEVAASDTDTAVES